MVRSVINRSLKCAMFAACLAFGASGARIGYALALIALALLVSEVDR